MVSPCEFQYSLDPSLRFTFVSGITCFLGGRGGGRGSVTESQVAGDFEDSCLPLDALFGSLGGGFRGRRAGGGSGGIDSMSKLTVLLQNTFS